MSKSNLDALNLSPEKLAKVALVYEGYAEGLFEKDGVKVDPEYKASSYVISACFILPVDPSKAKAKFYEAAKIYKELGQPIWKLYGICSDNYEGILKEQSNGVLEYEDNQAEQFFTILADFYLSVSSRKNREVHYEERLRSFHNEFVGKVPNLGIPLNFIIELIDDAKNWNGEINKNNLVRFSELLRRSVELLNLNQSDSYHWQNMFGSMIPIEPITIAVIVPLLKKWNSFSNIIELITLIEPNNKERLFLALAESIIKKNNSENT
ncbi:hypothetical protein [Pedobacter hiemivivus]|uniref:Uncharacterized protein n=1 Tax=Pedobacter hiemivivus TaxID=2530454 RepID=A0A4R0N509_9SPHI|nr:hypothetical protein [Pedobacter hiemivivus]TCC95039.1 hypothetical protein EZ444_16160 [Pedobacter hiemivivus]